MADPKKKYLTIIGELEKGYAERLSDQKL
jgi:hypothetical protein